MSACTETARLLRAACQYFLDARLSPAEMRVLLYLITAGFVAPEFLPGDDWPGLAERFEISPDWLGASLRTLYRAGIVLREPGERRHRPGYAVDPAWGEAP